MTKAGERALLQYLGIISSVLVGILGTKTNNTLLHQRGFSSVQAQLTHVLEVWEDYEKSSEKM